MENYDSFIEQLKRVHKDAHRFPTKSQVELVVARLFDVLFRNHSCVPVKDVEAALNLALTDLTNCLQQEALSDERSVHSVVSALKQQLPQLYSDLLLDADAIEKGDPAAVSQDEVIRTYPGFLAISYYRLAHVLWSEGVSFIPRMITEIAHSKTGIDIHPGAQIGQSFFIDHGTGIVIGETTVIGNYVKLYQSVTLGALSVQKELSSTKRHPTIEDRVVIYAGATILGGETVIGEDSIIGGNTWITESVPSQSLVTHTSKVTIKQRTSYV
ncbi:MAG: serine O-acetyltransferase [Fluviicola sp.]|nr:serine O-acetyltransferase [Fluviicola sp.]